MGGYKRQLSNFGAAVVAFALSAMLIGAALLLAQTMVAFGALLLAISCGIVGSQVLAYPLRRRIVMPDGVSIIFAGWALGAPLAGVIAPIADALGPRLIARLVSDTDGPFARCVMAFASVLIVVQLLLTSFVFARLYFRTPRETRFEGELETRGLPLAAVVFGWYFFIVAMFVSAPTATALGLIAVGRHTKAAIVAGPLLYLAVCPAALLGLALIRRGFWLREVAQTVDALPRSTIRAAAVGPVELTGTARPLDPSDPSDRPLLRFKEKSSGNERVANDFCLEDATGRVRVRIPEDAIPGVDGNIYLSRRSVTHGLERDFILCPGETTYVLGAYTETPSGPEIRPWAPPVDRFLVPFVNCLFDRKWDWSQGGFDLGPAIGLDATAATFVVSDMGEPQIRQALRRRWMWSILLGLLLLGGAGLLVGYRS